jgi:hypothetical protein
MVLYWLIVSNICSDIFKHDHDVLNNMTGNNLFSFYQFLIMLIYSSYLLKDNLPCGVSVLKSLYLNAQSAYIDYSKIILFSSLKE